VAAFSVAANINKDFIVMFIYGKGVKAAFHACVKKCCLWSSPVSTGKNGIGTGTEYKQERRRQPGIRDTCVMVFHPKFLGNNFFQSTTMNRVTTLQEMPLSSGVDTGGVRRACVLMICRLHPSSKHCPPISRKG
jgi:hypothetical protein